MADDGGTTLFELDPVQLPAPEGGGGKPASLAGRAFVSVALLVGLLAVSVLAVLVAVGLNLLAWQAGRVVGALVVLAIAVVAGVGRGLLVMLRRPPEPADEVEVPAEREPELHTMVRELAQQVGTRPPDRICVTADVNAYVREFGPLMGLVPGPRTMALGIPLVDALTVSQLRAVLAHELGHLAGGDTRLGPLAYRTDAATRQMAMALEGRLLGRLFFAYWAFQHRVSAAVRRNQELIADRAAVAVAGRQAAADALQRIEVAGRAEALYHQAYLGPFAGAGLRPDDLAGGLRRLLTSPTQVRALAAAGGAEDHDPWASHPPTPVRIARVAAIPETTPVPVDARPARLLLRDAEHWSQVAHERWLETVLPPGAVLERASWDRFGEAVTYPNVEQAAATVDGILDRLGLPPGPEGLRQAAAGETGTRLAAELAATGWSGGTDSRRGLLALAIEAVATRALIQAGGRHALSWDGPIELVDAGGAPVDVEALSEQAAGGDWAALDAVLAGEGRPRRRRRRPTAAQEGDAVVEAAAAAPEPAPASAPTAPRGPVPLPAPPVPPFAPVGDGTWRVELPTGVGRKPKVLVVSPEGIGDDGTIVAYDDLRTVSVKVAEASGELKVTFALGTGRGKPWSLTSASSKRDGKRVLATTVQHVLTVLDQRVAPRLRDEVVAAIESGETVTVANVRLNREGLAGRSIARQVSASWADVTKATFTEDGDPMIVLASGKILVRGLGNDNAFLLPDLVRSLQVRFG